MNSLVARFVVQYSNGAVVSCLCVLVRISYRCEACSSQFAQGAHHVKDDACLPGLTEVQVVAYDDIKKIIRSQCAISGRFDVIAGHKELLPSIRRCKDRSVRIVYAVSEKLESQKRVCSSAFSQINLDGIGLPFSI